MAVGDAGPYDYSASNSQKQTVRIYLNLSAEGAVVVMNSLTDRLNKIFVPFSFKTLYNPSNYERYDSAVLYFDRSNYEAVKQILNFVYVEHQKHFHKEVPLFTKFLLPGLALAEEPNVKFSDEESFGINRCQIVVNALIEAHQKGDESPEARMTEIFKHFAEHNIDLQRPYLNSNNEDIYTSLDF
jgi:hypothetical protein